MHKLLLAALAALTIIGCRNEHPGPPPVAGVDTGDESTSMAVDTDNHMITDTNPLMTMGSGVDDSSGGEECGDWQVYTCRGWHAGVYRNGTTERFDFSTVPPDGEIYAGCERFDICILSVGDADNEMLYAACKEEAEARGGPPYPAHPYSGGSGSAWNYNRTEFVFADNANFGVLGGGIIGTVNPTNLGCGGGWIPEDSTHPKSPQCLTGDCLLEDQCPAEAGQSCTGWDPGSHITSSLNTTTKTYTTTIGNAWLTALAEDMFDSVGVCDSGAWTWSTSASPDKWRMQDLASRDLLYKMGFRNLDEQIRIKKAGSSTWYNLYGTSWLDGMDKVAAAFGALSTYTSFVIEFKRPVGGTLVTYTMNLSFT